MQGYFVDYRTWSQTSLDTTLGALRAAGLQGQQLDNEQSVLSALRGMAQSAEGRLEALQVMGEISEQQVQQLMKLRELMMADMSKQSYQAAVIQKQAASEAATERFFNWDAGGFRWNNVSIRLEMRCMRFLLESPRGH